MSMTPAAVSGRAKERLYIAYGSIALQFFQRHPPRHIVCQLLDQPLQRHGPYLGTPAVSPSGTAPLCLMPEFPTGQQHRVILPAKIADKRQLDPFKLESPLLSEGADVGFFLHFYSGWQRPKGEPPTGLFAGGRVLPPAGRSDLVRAGIAGDIKKSQLTILKQF